MFSETKRCDPPIAAIATQAADRHLGRISQTCLHVTTRLSTAGARLELRGKEGRHRPRMRLPCRRCLRSYGFSDRERDETCALAIAWKHALASHARRSRTRSRTPLLPSQKPSVRTCPPLTLARSCLRPGPRSKRARQWLGTSAFVLVPAWAGLSQRRPGATSQRGAVSRRRASRRRRAHRPPSAAFHGRCPTGFVSHHRSLSAIEVGVFDAVPARPLGGCGGGYVADLLTA